MNDDLLRDSARLLKDIRAELHGNVDDSVLQQLDKVIHDLEAAQRGRSEKVISALEILILLGTLLGKIPEIAKVIEYLTLVLKNTPNH